MHAFFTSSRDIKNVKHQRFQNYLQALKAFFCALREVIMTKSLFFILVILFVTTSTALTAQTNCTEISKLAQSIMSARQKKGYTLKHMLKRAQDNTNVIMLIHKAYEEPVHATAMDKEQAIKNFTDTAYGECWRKTR